MFFYGYAVGMVHSALNKFSGALLLHELQMVLPRIRKLILHLSYFLVEVENLPSIILLSLKHLFFKFLNQLLIASSKFLQQKFLLRLNHKLILLK